MEKTGHPTEGTNALQDRIVNLRQNEIESDRIVIALAGIPGSGKSTIATKLSESLHRAGVHDVAVVPMVMSLRNT
jgi:adenylylsulfate kinase-like enzyme